MLTDMQLESISDMQTVTNIPVLLFDKNGNEQVIFPAHFGNLLTQPFLVEAATRCKDGILSISWDSLYHCVVFPMDQNTYLITAPTSIMAHHQGILFQAMTKWVQPKRQADFIRLVSETPPVSQYQLVKLAHLYRKICNLPTVISLQQWNQSSSNYIPRKAQYEEEIRPVRQKHATYYEPHVVEAIQSGNIEQLQHSYHRPMDGYVGRMSLDDLRQARYYFVCYIFFSSRAAATSGVPWEICMQLSDRYCQQMDSLNQIEAIFNLLWTALVDYCQRVAECRDWLGYAPSTRRCLEYIDQHVYDPIRMEHLVDFCQLNQRSISQYFKKDMSMTIPVYINNRRLKEAAVLLQETDLSVGQISSLLQYSSQSYMGQLFLKKYGMTPLQYRSNRI